MSTDPTICPTCQTPIPDDAPGGLCPRCALAGAAGTRTDGRFHFEAPSVEELAAAFPQLEIIELIARGGMGAVYRAKQPHLDREVALKILPPALAERPGFTERFTREGRVLARLNHPHIVTVHDFGETGGFCYLLMEFVNGVNLRQAMQNERFTPAQALGIVPTICEALQFAHEEGVLHRDIKPENILLDAKGRVKIADFGIAKLLEEGGVEPTLTASMNPGTPHYMAPEQIEHPGDVDHRADIYSLGVVFYEMLTGELPIGRFAPPSEKSAVGAQVDEVVFRSLEKERENRQQSAQEMQTQVETLGDGTAMSAPKQQDSRGPLSEEHPGKGPGRALLMSLAALCVPMLLALVVMLAAQKLRMRISQDQVQQEVQAHSVLVHQEMLKAETQLLKSRLANPRELEPGEAEALRQQIAIKERAIERHVADTLQHHASVVYHGPTFLRGFMMFAFLMIPFYAIAGTTAGWREARRLRMLGIRRGRGAAMTAAWLWPLLITNLFIIGFLFIPGLVIGNTMVILIFFGLFGLAAAILFDTLLIWRGRCWMKEAINPKERAAFAARPPYRRSRWFMPCALLITLPVLLIAGLFTAQLLIPAPETREYGITLDRLEEKQFELWIDLTVHRNTDLNVNVSIHFDGPKPDSATDDHDFLYPGTGQEFDLFGEQGERKETLRFRFADRQSASAAAQHLRGLLGRNQAATFNDLERVFLFIVPDSDGKGHAAWIELSNGNGDE